MYLGSWRLKTAPTEEPVTLAEAKAHLRLVSGDDDSYVDALIKTARIHLEGISGRAFVTQEWNLYLDAFPAAIKLPRPPLVYSPAAVPAVAPVITYLDAANASQTLSNDDYVVDDKAEPARIMPAYGVCWPTTYPIPNAVQVAYTCGYGAAGTVPNPIKQALLLLVGHLYENREATTEVALQAVPLAVDALTDSYRVERF